MKSIGFWAAFVSLAGCPGEENALENVTVEELGSFTTNADGEVDIPWTAPEDVVSTEVVCGPYGFGDNLATAETITAPSGDTVYDWENEDGYGLPMRVGTLSDYLPVLIPVSPDAPAESGDYTMKLILQVDPLPAQVDCSHISRTGNVAGSNTINVDVVFVGVDGIAPGFTAGTAEGDDTMASVLDGLGNLWGDLGYSLGNVRYFDFDGDVDTYTTIEGEEELGKLLRSSSEGGQLTFYFVQDIDLGDGASILGLSGGPPGAAVVGGTSISGVVVNVANVAAAPEDVSLIMAHEGGHFVGLFHPTEKDGARFDPLGDTPECAVSDGQANSDECGGKGTDNVMWWAATSGTATSFSDDQAWVASRNPLAVP